MDLVLACKRLPLAAHFIGEVDLLFLRHQAQHARHARNDRRKIDALRLRQQAAVKARQAQQIFRNARKALRFLLNVADEFAHSLRVHILRLQNGIRQQANTRKRRFELVARIGYKAAARVLNGLQAIRHVVELGGKLADLVISADFGAVAVRAFAHFSNGVGQHAEAPRQHAG